MEENELLNVDSDVTELTARPQGASLLDAGQDNVLYLAEKAEKYIAAMNKIMKAALQITTELDWVLIGGTPYLQESGATKVARLFGISWKLLGNPIVECDENGYKTFTYKARFMLNGQFIEAEGSRSMKDEFFTGKDNPEKGKTKKTADEVDERDVKMSAYTNLINNGIKRLIPGLRNIDITTLESAGFDCSKIRGYTFKTGSKGGNSGKAEDSGLVCDECGAAITQKVASYSESKFGKKLCYDCQKKQGAKPAPKQPELPPIDDNDLPFN